MTSKGRAAIVVVLVALFAGGASAALYLREKNEEALANDADAAIDGSVDARAAVAKGKTAKKKKTVRGGKTKVAPRTAAAHPPGPQPASHPASHPASNPVAPPVPDEPPDENDRGNAPAPPRPHVHRSYPSGASYESAIAANNQQVSIGANSGPDLSDAQLSGPMSDGSFIDECDAPDDMGITVKVAIRMGRAVGVTVITSPHSGEVAGCIAHHVRGLSWPSSPKMDSFVTTY